MKKNWYAVYTRPKSEKKVASYLTKKRIDCFCPMNRVIKSNSFEKTKVVEEPLFPSYVFINLNESEFQTAKHCSEIINFLYWLGRPVTFKEIEIENLKDFTENHNNIQTQKINVSLNNMVRIVNKFPIIDKEDNIVQLNNTLISLTLPTLGYKLTAYTSELFEQATFKEMSKLVVS
jgi:transcription antitermination factor NusG